MLLFIAAAASVAAAPAVTTPQEKPSLGGVPICEQTGVHKVGNTGKRGAHKLSDEPSAKEVKAVLYTEGGCSKPIVVNDSIGNVRPKK